MERLIDDYCRSDPAAARSLNGRASDSGITIATRAGRTIRQRDPVPSTPLMLNGITSHRIAAMNKARIS